MGPIPHLSFFFFSFFWYPDDMMSEELKPQGNKKSKRDMQLKAPRPWYPGNPVCMYACMYLGPQHNTGTIHTQNTERATDACLSVCKLYVRAVKVKHGPGRHRHRHRKE